MFEDANFVDGFLMNRLFLGSDDGPLLTEGCTMVKDSTLLRATPPTATTAKAAAAFILLLASFTIFHEIMDAMGETVEKIVLLSFAPRCPPQLCIFV